MATRSSRIISSPRAAWKIRISLPLPKMELWVISNTTRAGLPQLKSSKQIVERLASRGAFWTIRLKVRWTLASHLTPRLWMLRASMTITHNHLRERLASTMTTSTAAVISGSRPTILNIFTGTSSLTTQQSQLLATLLLVVTPAEPLKPLQTPNATN